MDQTSYTTVEKGHMLPKVTFLSTQFTLWIITLTGRSCQCACLKYLEMYLWGPVLISGVPEFSEW